MERKTRGLWRVLGLVILALLSTVTAEGITCPEAVAALMPCQRFLVGTEPSPPAPCCLAVDFVNKQATTKEVRQQLCECCKKVGPSLRVKPDRAKQLPGLCKVAVPVPIDPSIDCSKIK